MTCPMRNGTIRIQADVGDPLVCMECGERVDEASDKWQWVDDHHGRPLGWSHKHGSSSSWTVGEKQYNADQEATAREFQYLYGSME